MVEQMYNIKQRINQKKWTQFSDITKLKSTLKCTYSISSFVPNERTASERD